MKRREQSHVAITEKKQQFGIIFYQGQVQNWRLGDLDLILDLPRIAINLISVAMSTAQEEQQLIAMGSQLADAYSVVGIRINQLHRHPHSLLFISHCHSNFNNLQPSTLIECCYSQRQNTLTSSRKVNFLHVTAVAEFRFSYRPYSHLGVSSLFHRQHSFHLATVGTPIEQNISNDFSKAALEDALLCDSVECFLQSQQTDLSVEEGNQQQVIQQTYRYDSQNSSLHFQSAPIGPTRLTHISWRLEKLLGSPLDVQTVAQSNSSQLFVGLPHFSEFFLIVMMDVSCTQFHACSSRLLLQNGSVQYYAFMKVSACIIEGVSDGQTVSNGSLFKEFEYFLDVVVLQLYHT